MTQQKPGMFQSKKEAAVVITRWLLLVAVPFVAGAVAWWLV
jgi:hypothetical protein